MTVALYTLCTGLTGVALLYRMRALRTDRSPAQLALTGVFFFALCIWVVLLPGLWDALGDLAGLPNLSGLLSHIAVMLVTACQQLVLLHLRHDTDLAWRKATPRLLAIGVVIVVIVGLFLRAVDRLGEHPTDFAIATAAGNPAYLSVYLAAFAVGQAEVARLCWRYRAVAPTVWLRRSLGLIVVTIGVLWIYILGRLAAIVAGFFGVSGHAWEPVTLIAVVVGSTTHLFAWLLPDLGPQLSRLAAALARPRAYRELLPLHHELTTHVPSVVLRAAEQDTAGAPEVAVYRDPRADLRLRLYRLIIEIRDAQWALRTWMSPEAADAAERAADEHALRGHDRQAAIEAAMLDAALRARQSGERPHCHVDSPQLAEPEDLAAELAYQRRLARHFRRRRTAALPVPSQVPAGAQPSGDATAVEEPT
ncbi:MAB_1171c family putative transporter [Haloechinothrix sp. LS1_15]|uniref:MAB_1171c family putative transporter n=1 Tax=Haloechinothrix sp. LS1_15 TaxID=2652248 RepID=UPI002945BDBD|nr:MAB_1171c family putative transporter [Haloechinothrix sp. LS1_15]MDV6011926.1 hypothetical protein [Haloechinothrix sp. LS1_15]